MRLHYILSFILLSMLLDLHSVRSTQFRETDGNESYIACLGGSTCENPLGVKKCSCQLTSPVADTPYCKGGNEAVCTSNPTYLWDDNVCKDVRECKLDGWCHANSRCQNTIRGSVCNCMLGFTGDGIDCTDIDECADPGTFTCDADATCVNTIGSYICICNPGYSGTGKQCDDVIECDTTCRHENSDCRNTVGSYTCGCLRGFTGNRTFCGDIDECSSDNECDANANCNNTIGSYQCTCDVGYSGNGRNCDDINECNDGSNDCHSNAKCINTVGSYSCMCRVGFSGNGTFCEDINECKLDNSSDCDRNANCTNKIGSYDCTCNDGYTGNGKTCTDTDECVHGNGDAPACNTTTEECNNTVGSFSCFCKSGFTIIDGYCEDVDECSESNKTICDQNANCSNIIGNYNCECVGGYTRNGTACEDIDECSLDDFTDCYGNNEECNNTVGSFICVCKVGFERNETSQNCEDINECSFNICDPNANCSNSVGSYVCTCLDGYIEKGEVCEDVDECLNVTICNNTMKECNNTIGSFECLCKDGFRANDSFCEDVDECSLSNGSVCDSNANCTNYVGNYTCTCVDGYSGNGTDCYDINECLQDVCNTTYEDCVNNIGSFSCVCKQGFTGNATSCEDIDECALENSTVCDQKSNCSNSVGSYNCNCIQGYEKGEGEKCQDIDECLRNDTSCHLHAGCVNTNGSYYCSCNQGFTGNGTHCEIVIVGDQCGPGFTGNVTNCTDIDECEIDNPCSHENATCKNTIGSFNCICDPGFSGNDTYCADVNECESSPCDDYASCNNTVGKYECTCNDGFLGNGSYCEDIDECQKNTTCSKFPHTTCKNVVGSFNCTCNPGFYANDSICQDVDECVNHPCDRNASCENIVGTFNCTCNHGFSGNGTHCDDVNECENDALCHINATCQNHIGDFECLCDNGFSGNGTHCDDIDECSGNTSCRHKNATCHNVIGSYQCGCQQGFTGNHTFCEDVDECMRNDSCHENANCSNTAGSFYCTCVNGYIGNGSYCEDIDECDNNALSTACPHPHAVCNNFDGGYNCTCYEGFTGNQTYCEDIDECEWNHDCDKNAKCNNTIGSFNCTCVKGFTGNGKDCKDVDECESGTVCIHSNAVCDNLAGTFNCSCEKGFTGNHTYCEDINECHGNHSCHQNATCSNNAGSYICTCFDGFKGNGTFCEDVDECDFDWSCSHPNAVCENSVGTYNCSCEQGYTGNHVSCVDINECDWNDTCHENATCTNRNGSHSCECNEGFSGNGTHCVDVNECVVSNPCDKDATCRNSIGSYSCTCNKGYSGDGKDCEDIDECRMFPCDGNATCINYIGWYNCTCNAGYTGDGAFCEDINECLGEWQPVTRCYELKDEPSWRILYNGSWYIWRDNPLRNPCADNGVCHNEIARFNCTCNTTYTGDAYETCGRVEYLQLSGMTTGDHEMRNQGFVEVIALQDIAQRWGVICDAKWTRTESDVVCRELGYTNSSFLSSTVTKQTITHDWVDRVRCNGTENHLVECSAGLYGSANCTGHERVKIVCSNATKGDEGDHKLFYQSAKGQKYNFKCMPWEVRRVIKSEETCENDDRAAAIECTASQNKTGSEEMEIDFDYETFQEFNCNSSVDTLLEETTNATNKNSTASDILGDLSAVSENMTSGITNTTSDVLSEMTSIINNLNEQKDGERLRKPIAFYLIWCFNNFDMLMQQAGRDGTENSTLIENNLNVTNKMQFIHSVNEIISSIIFREDNITVETLTTVLKSVKFGEDKNVVTEGVKQENRHTPRSTVSRPSFPDGKKATATANVIFAYNASVFPKPTEPDESIKEVVDLSFTGTIGENVSGNIDLEMPFDYSEKAKSSDKKGMLYFHQCVRLLRNGTWSSEGCKTGLVNNSYTTCKTKYHSGVTAFSVLVKAYPVQDSLALGIAGYIGCILSTITLLAALVMYTVFKTLRKNQMNQIHIHLCACLLTFYVTYLAGVERNKGYIPCVIVAGVLQFCMLSAWGWMLVESVTMFRKFWFPLKKLGNHYILLWSALIYVVCGVAVTVNAILTTRQDAENWKKWHLAFANDVSFRPSTYIGDVYCWLHGESLRFGFLVPAGTVFLANFVFGIIIIRKITMDSQVRSRQTDARQNLIRAATVTLLLGLPWMVGIPLVLTDMKSINDIFGWLFTLLNAFQGVLIFIVLCVLRDDARKQWMTKVNDVKSTLSKSNATVSTIGSEMTSKSSAGRRRSTLISQLLQSTDGTPSTSCSRKSRGSLPEVTRKSTNV